ncbi:MAG: hypothetical protein OXC48_10890, partial [Endozoicomonadaceae bacterium]|nr:hypothetical protein [Endozoicomonadaceae bacterium]
MFENIQNNKKFMFASFIILCIIFLLTINQSGYSQSDRRYINFTENEHSAPYTPLTNNTKNNQHNNSNHTKVNQQASDESTPWSNAFNFKKSMGT